jgi:hypothetical protein
MAEWHERWRLWTHREWDVDADADADDKIFYSKDPYWPQTLNDPGVNSINGGNDYTVL